MNLALWIVQGVLALLFLFAGVTKLVMPIEEMTKQMPVQLPMRGGVPAVHRGGRDPRARSG